MGLENTEAEHAGSEHPTPPVPPPAPLPPAPDAQPRRGPGRPPKPVDPLAREKRAKRATVRRVLDTVTDAADEEEMWRKLDAARARRTGAKTSGSTVGAAPPAPPAPSPTADAEQMLAEMTDFTSELWGSFNEAVLVGTRYELKNTVRKVIKVVDGKAIPVEKAVDQLAQLARGTAPLAAQLMPNIVTTPLGLAGLTVALVFAPTAARHAGEVIAPRVAMWWHQRKQEAKALAVVAAEMPVTP